MLRTPVCFLSYRRLSPQFQFSLSAATLVYLSQWIGLLQYNPSTGWGMVWGGTARLTVSNIVTDGLSLEYKQPFLSGWEWNFVPKKFSGIDWERFLLFLGKIFIPRLFEDHERVYFEAWNGTILHYAKKVSFTKKLVFLFHGWGNSGLFSLPLNNLERNSEILRLFLFQGTEFWAFFSSAEWFGREFHFEFSVPGNSDGTNYLFRLFHLLRNYFFVRNPLPYPYGSYLIHSRGGIHKEKKSIG